MSQTYYTLVTNLGAALLAQATTLGTKLKLTHVAVGDGNGNLPSPSVTQKKLVNEKRRGAINAIYVDSDNANQIIIEQVIPPEEGGFYIREIGLFDENNNLIAVGNCPPSYKPVLSEGSGRTQVINMVIIVDNTGSVELKIDASSVVATRKYVDDLIIKTVQIGDFGIGTTKLPFLSDFASFDTKSGLYYASGDSALNATLNAPVGSGNNTLTVTVRNRDKKVVHFEVIQNHGTTPVKWIGTYFDQTKGVLWEKTITGKGLSSSVTNDSELHIATSKAVKAAYDKASASLQTGDFGIGSTKLPFLSNFALFDIENGLYYALGDSALNATLNAPIGSGDNTLTVTVRNRDKKVVHFEVIQNHGTTPVKWIGTYFDQTKGVLWEKTITGKGLSSSVTNDSELHIATSKAVKAAYDKASASLQAGDFGIGSTKLPFLSDFALFDIENGLYYALGDSAFNATLNAPVGSGNNTLTVTVRNRDKKVVHFEVIQNHSTNPAKWIGTYFDQTKGILWEKCITVSSLPGLIQNKIIAWGRFDYSTNNAINIIASNGISSITRTATGKYTIILSNEIDDAKYTVTCNAQQIKNINHSFASTAIPMNCIDSQFEIWIGDNNSDSFNDSSNCYFTVIAKS